MTYSETVGENGPVTVQLIGGIKNQKLKVANT